jgi:signal transduction histidine kinase
MRILPWFRAPRIVLTLFICLMVVCAAALGWLGWQIVIQDRAVEAQREQEFLTGAADRVVVAITRALMTADAEVTVTAAGEVQVSPAGKLAFTPTETSQSPLPADIFAEAEAFEFQNRDRARAAAIYARLAKSGSLPVRAAALVRLGRVQRRERMWPDALQTYRTLESFEGTFIAGIPASLIARTARCSILKESGSADAFREAAAVWADLTAGKWRLGKATLETYLNDLRTIAPQLELSQDWSDRMILAEAAAWAFQQHTAKGREAHEFDGNAASVFWETRDGAWIAKITGPKTWRNLWKKLEQETGAVLRLTDHEGRVVYGNLARPGQSAFRAASMSGLPWNITMSPAEDDALSSYWIARRRFLIAGMAIFAVVLALGSFLIARAIDREFAVARLQSDFVAAVSHEFRTPLTSIRQLSEMLARGRMENEQDKNRAYELILGQSERLRRLVESLLDFGRMQAREFKFRSESLDAADCFRAVAEEFEQTVRSRGYHIDFSDGGQDVPIRGDREALSNALWNFLDNAVKYSPDEKQIGVFVLRVNGTVEVRVRDCGAGIPKEDLTRVFGKFFRGANAKAQGTQGTGIGLAVVKEIVEAHGGTVRVRSKIGEGSEFTMVLPCRES